MLPAWTLLFCGFALLAFFLHLDQLLQYDRHAILAGEWWRLLTGHLTHWSSDHLFWDLTTFGALGLLAERRSRKLFLLCIASAAVAISTAAWFLRADVVTYRGLSGIDVALFALVATRMDRDARGTGDRATAALAAAALAALGLKLAWELTSGSALFVDAAASGFESLPIAHAAGALAGALCACFTKAGNPHSRRARPPLRYAAR